MQEKEKRRDKERREKKKRNEDFIQLQFIQDSFLGFLVSISISVEVSVFVFLFDRSTARCARYQTRQRSTLYSIYSHLSRVTSI